MRTDFVNTQSGALNGSQFSSTAWVSRAAKRTRKRVDSTKWLVNFILIQFGLQLFLLFGPTGVPRGPIRAISFGLSLLMLLLIPGTRTKERHPSINAAALIIFILCISVFNPTTNSWFSGVAQIGLYAAILAPIFWVPRLNLDAESIRKALFVFWGFHTLSAIFGVLQVYYPGQFQPNISQVYLSRPDILGSMFITLANGQRVLRPMGLTDIPGGASVAGVYSVLLGMGFFLTSRKRLILIASCISMAAGMACLYLSQTRSMLIMGAVCVLVFLGLLAVKKLEQKLIILIGIMTIVVVGGFFAAVLIGGQSVTKRLATLSSDSPGQVYYSNRGIFLRETVTELLPQYPLGAGLGRWGMVNYYFGNNSDPERASIWVEIQWTGWLLDGGIPLIIVYVSAIFFALRTSWNVGLKPAVGEMRIWGALLVAYSLGAVVLTFSYPVFIGQLGLEFWLLNAALFTVVRNSPPQKITQGASS